MDDHALESDFGHKGMVQVLARKIVGGAGVTHELLRRDIALIHGRRDERAVARAAGVGLALYSLLLAPAA